MNDKNNIDELQAAESLDAHLTSLQKNQPTSPDGDSEQLAGSLHTLAEQSQMDPAFRTALAQRLRQRAREKQTHKPFLSLSRIFPTGGSFMNTNRIFIFAGAAALALILAIVVLGQNPQPIASLTTDTPAAANPTTETVDTQEPAASPTALPATPTSEQPSPTSPVLPTAVPALPVLSDWLVNSGMGGGGLPYALGLGIDLPTDSATLTAYLLRHPGTLDEVAILDLALRLGLENPKVFKIGDKIATIVIENQKEIVIGGPSDFSYTDRAVFNFPGGRYYYPDEKVPSEEVVAAAATTFLDQARLLEAPYEVEVFGEFARFYHVQEDNRRVDGPFAVITVSPDGLVGIAIVQSQESNAIGSYDVLSAAEAWALVNDPDAAQRWFTTLQLAEDRNPPIWVRSYVPGTSVDINGPLTVYDATVPYIRTNGLQVTADPAQLQAMADAYISLRELTMDVEAPMRVWGVIGPDGWTLEMQGYEVGTAPAFWTGLLTRTADNNGLLAGIDGQTYTLPDLPTDLPDSLNVFVMGGLVDGRIEWTVIQKSVEGWTPDEMPVPVTIESAVLGYYAPDGLTLVQANVQDTEYWMLQPVWRFTGKTKAGDVVTVYVQAVK